jgi:hypothetical protein
VQVTTKTIERDFNNCIEGNNAINKREFIRINGIIFLYGNLLVFLRCLHLSDFEDQK